MSIDWKARCAEHCGTIGNRDATIEKLQAQLETEKQSNARWQEWSLRDQKQLDAVRRHAESKLGLADDILENIRAALNGEE